MANNFNVSSLVSVNYEINRLNTLNDVIKNKILNKDGIRYLQIDEFTIFNYNFEDMFDYFKHKSRLYGRYIPYEIQKTIAGDSFDSKMTAEYNYSLLTTFDQINHLIRLYLTRVISETPFYNGPYSNETTYILPELLNILYYGVNTLDSQPGFFVEDEYLDTSYIQLPYLEILATSSNIIKIIDGFNKFTSINPLTSEYYSIGGSYLRLTSRPQNSDNYLMIPDIVKNYNSFINKYFPYLSLTENVYSIIFCVKVPQDENDFESFMSYIFTNQFFNDIRYIIHESL